MAKKTRKVNARHWYSPIYRENDYGFFVEYYNSKYFLGYRPKDKRKNDTLVMISKSTFDALKKEWR